MSNMTEWRAEATPDRATVGVCFDRALLSELQEAEDALKAGKAVSEKALSSSEDVKALEAKADSLRAQAKEKTRTFVFEGIGRRAWADIVASHLPTDEQKEEHGDVLDHNPDTFPPAALAATCSDPKLTKDDARWLMDTLPLAAWNRIWGACLSVNVVGSRDPFERGFGGVLTIGTK